MNKYLKRKLGPHTTNGVWLVSHQAQNLPCNKKCNCIHAVHEGPSMWGRSRGFRICREQEDGSIPRYMGPDEDKTEDRGQTTE